jgi:hypothetical protein
LFAIGVIGEYLARLHFRTMGKPPYVIREQVGNDVLEVAQPPYVIREQEGNDVLEVTQPPYVVQQKAGG